MRGKWIVLLFGIVLAAPGGRMGWAARARAPNGINPAAPDLARPNPAGVAPSLPMPASAPWELRPPIILDVTLVGTVVVEGGPSLAVFEGARGSRLVWEGEEIVPGVRLLQVDWNWVDVERGGIRQEIRLGSSEGIRQEIRLGSNEEIRQEIGPGSSQGIRPKTRLSSIGAAAAPGEAASAGVQRALELRAQKFQALMEWRARQQPQKRE